MTLARYRARLSGRVRPGPARRADHREPDSRFRRRGKDRRLGRGACGRAEGRRAACVRQCVSRGRRRAHRARRARCSRAAIRIPNHRELSRCARRCSIPIRRADEPPGIGPKLAKLFARLLDREAPRVTDLLFHLPSGTIDRRARPKLRDVVPDTIVTVTVTVDKHRPPPPNRPRAPYQIYASDETGDITLTYFKRARIIWRSCCRSASGASCRAQPPSTTACCKWCIRTAWCRKPTSTSCRWSSRSIR